MKRKLNRTLKYKPSRRSFLKRIAFTAGFVAGYGLVEQSLFSSEKRKSSSQSKCNMDACACEEYCTQLCDDVAQCLISCHNNCDTQCSTLPCIDGDSSFITQNRPISIECYVSAYTENDDGQPLDNEMGDESEFAWFGKWGHVRDSNENPFQKLFKRGN